jgi:polyhydroxybutyrate depolymerase
MKARALLAIVTCSSLLAACGDDTGSSSSGGGSGGASATGSTTGQGSPSASSGAQGTSSSGDGGGSSSGGTPSSSGASSPTASSSSGGATVGCGQGSPTGVVPISIDVEGTTRTGILSVPETYDPNTPIPLVFAWHGAGNDGEGARGYFGIEQASAGGAIFVYLDGLPVDGGGSGWDLTGDGREIDLFDAELAAIVASYCIDDERIFSTGHSYGGYMTNAVGCARPDVFRAIAPVAGGGPFFECDPVGLPALVIHGDPDDVVSFDQGVDSRDHWIEQNGCAATSQATEPEGCVLYDGCATGPMEFCVHGENHNWPGMAAGTIWGFFEQF